MKKVILFLLLLVVFSCQKKQNEFPHVAYIHEEVVFDSTYYFLLKDGYLNRDTLLLNHFFDLWNKISLSMQAANENKIAKTLNDIFAEIYYPFNYEKYGWSSREWLSQYKYAILPSEIKYKITNSKYDVSNVFQMATDTLKAFYPNPNIGKAKKLFDIDPFKKSMELFLENEAYEKLSFLDSCYFVSMPISLDWKMYRTTPEIKGVFINKKLNHAVAYLRLVSTVICIELSFENKKWTIKKMNYLWQG